MRAGVGLSRLLGLLNFAAVSQPGTSLPLRRPPALCGSVSDRHRDRLRPPSETLSDRGSAGHYGSGRVLSQGASRGPGRETGGAPLQTAGA